MNTLEKSWWHFKNDLNADTHIYVEREAVNKNEFSFWCKMV